MNLYFNPGNELFQKVLNLPHYVDKTGLIEHLNRLCNTDMGYVCVTRPRRFGKTVTLKMLAAYYSKGCSSRDLFSKYEIAKMPSFEKELNKNNVILLDIQGLATLAKQEKINVIDYINSKVTEEIIREYPNLKFSNPNLMMTCLEDIYKQTGEQFIALIDEWDAVYRVYPEDEELKKDYKEFLRPLFKSLSGNSICKLAYITGILPIKKYGSQSELNNFDEIDMFSISRLQKYIGFTANEVEKLCQETGMSIDEMRHWYDGYKIQGTGHLFNSNSVMRAIDKQACMSYWSKTESFESLRKYINLNLNGLKDAVVELVSGKPVRLNSFEFAGDGENFSALNDCLVYLVHLGYLSYDYENQTVNIPNNEVLIQFKSALNGQTQWGGLCRAIEESFELLEATLNKDEEAVAGIIEKIHDESIPALSYNNENSLAAVVSLAYYAAKRDYRIRREQPAGKGFADIVIFPLAYVNKPAIIIEMKIDSTPQRALKQIIEKNYAAEFKNAFLVGINYSRKTKKHRVKIITKEEIELR